MLPNIRIFLLSYVSQLLTALHAAMFVLLKGFRNPYQKKRLLS